MEQYYRVILTASAKTPWFVKLEMEHNFMRLYNLACDLLNDKYEDWNREYGDKDDPDDYNKYICLKQNQVLSRLNDRKFEVFTDPELTECSIGIRARKHREWYMTMLLAPVN